jgi:hypothetical protein
MDRMADVRHCCTITQNNAFGQVRFLAAFLREHLDQIQVFPYFLDQVVQIQSHVTRYDDGVGYAGQAIEFFDGNLIDFIVDVQARHVNAIAHDDVDEIVSTAVFSETKQNGSTMK